MSDALTIVMVAAIFGLILGGLPLLAARVRRRGLTGGYSLMGPFDEMWHPIALEPRIEVQAQDERPAPAASPGDPLI